MERKIQHYAIKLIALDIKMSWIWLQNTKLCYFVLVLLQPLDPQHQ